MKPVPPHLRRSSSFPPEVVAAIQRAAGTRIYDIRELLESVRLDD